MSWAEVKKINSNMDVPLNSLFGTKINEHVENYIDKLGMNYDSYEYINYSDALKHKFYNEIWSNGNIITKITTNEDIAGYKQGPFSQDGTCGILVGTNGLWGVSCPYFSDSSSNPSGSNPPYKLFNLYDGYEIELFRFGHTAKAKGGLSHKFYRLSERELIIAVEYYQETVKTVSTKIIKVDFTEDGSDATFDIIVDDTTNGYSNVSKQNENTSGCFVSGKYVEIITSLTADTGNTYAKCNYLIDLISKTLVTSDKITNLSSGPYSNSDLSKPTFVEEDKSIKIKSVGNNTYYMYYKTNADLIKLTPSYQRKYIYDNTTETFTMLSIDNSIYYNNNTWVSGLNQTPINQDIIRTRFKAEYSQEEDKVIYSDVISSRIHGNCFSVRTNHHSSSNSAQCDWFNDLNVIRIIGKDAICIPPYINKGKNGVLDDNNSSYINETYIKYKNGCYTPYIIRNIDSDEPTVEYLNIPWLNNHDNWSINECLINNILGYGIDWQCATNNYKFINFIYPNMYNLCENRLILYAYEYFNGSKMVASNHNGRLDIQRSSGSNTSSPTYPYELRGFIMYSKEFNTVDEFLEIFNEFFMISIRKIPVIKGMKMVCDTQYILGVEGVPVSRDEDEPNILQVEKTGLLKINMASVNPDKNNPIMMTF